MREFYGKMNEVGLEVRGTALSPGSDCNSNHPGSASCLSNTSSQDIDFIQDNSDYQWFLDYGYRDNNHTSILSLADSYDVNDIGYYDTFAKNMDANLAEADMESFRTEDIHALLTNLPPMCTADHLSQESGNRQGESYASVSGSIMAKFDCFGSPHASSQEDNSANNSTTSMSICKSELLFSPVKENPMLDANFSVDSLDCELNEHDIMLTCQANKDNYTIVFEGSMMYSEDGDFHDNPDDALARRLKRNKLNASMTKSDCSTLTTWSKLKKRSSENYLRRLPSGNNNHSSNDESSLSEAPKSQSLPNLAKKPYDHVNRTRVETNAMSSSSTDSCTVKRRPVKVFDIQNQLQNNSTNGFSDQLSDMATSVDGSTTSDNSSKQNFSLVKLFMKQKSMSAEGMSTGLDHSSASENWNGQSSDLSNLSSDNNKRVCSNGVIEEDREEDSKSEDYDDDVRVKAKDFKSKSTNTKRFSGVSVSSDSSNSSFTQSGDRSKYPRYSKCVPLKLINKSMQTSVTELFKNPPYKLNTNSMNKSKQIKVIEPSFLNKLKENGEDTRPIYVMYPSYALPDLDFLNKRDDLKVLLMPQNVKLPQKRRPVSCYDFEALKRKGFDHVEDWDSLNVLLPKEYQELLADIPEVAQHLKSKRQTEEKRSFDKSSSSTATQPSSGYRGSSMLLTDSQSNHNPLFVYRYDSVTSSDASLLDKQEMKQRIPPLPKRSISLSDGTKTEAAPPRPPLPRSILRRDKLKKRYSVIEPEEIHENVKRLSLQEPLRCKRLSETEDEGVEITSSSSFDDDRHLFASPAPSDPFQLNNEDIMQLEEFLNMSGISMSDSDTDDLTMRSYVNKFLSLRFNQDPRKVSFKREGKFAPNNSPNVSAFHQRNQKTLVEICEEGETSPEGFSSPHGSPSRNRYNLEEKRCLVANVTDAVEHIIKHFSPATNQNELNALGDSELNPSCAKLTLATLCPALYSFLSDGLKPSLETSFGSIGNSVWQVVEASAQQGSLTKALNDLVMRINGEDVSEGLVKFNAFVFGLLNVRSLDAWLSYLRTRESILKKHYDANSSLLLSLSGSATVRSLLDTLIAALQPLALLPFQFDLLFEYRELHRSLNRIDSYHPSSPIRKREFEEEEVKFKVRPRSCIDKPNLKINEDAIKKRWSGVSLTSKLYQAYNKFAVESEEEYTDSLEANCQNYNQHHNQRQEETIENLSEDAPESLDSNLSDDKPLNGRKFKKLQRKWEMLSGKEERRSPPESPTHAKSRIPRPVVSPVKPSGIPVPISPTGKAKTPPSGQGAVKKIPQPTQRPNTSPCVKSNAAKKNINTTTRTSRLDQLENNTQPSRTIPRPSSLPYKPINSTAKNGKVTPTRRAASTSVSRKTAQPPKIVKTLSHRMPSESGHLSYNEGERLKVVLEVDEKWLLCCRGTQKGLVPRSAVIPDTGRF